MYSKLPLLLFVFACVSALVVKESTRNIDVSTSIAKVDVHLNIINDDTKALKQFVFPLSPSSTVTVVKVDGNVVKFSVNRDENSHSIVTDLPTSLAKGSSCSIDISYISADVYTPTPESMAMSDTQHVKIITSSNIVLPYRVQRQTTTVSGSSLFDSAKLTKIDGKSAKITLGPQEADFKAAPLDAVFVAQFPIVRGSLTRTLRLEPFVGAYFKEEFALSHKGSVIEGEWSRFDLQRNPKLAQASMNQINLKLLPYTNPKSISYRDYIGNISTSQYISNSQADTDLQLIPRFPLYGGWNFKFSLTGKLLKSAFNQMMNTREARVALIPAVDDVFFDRVNVRVSLPQFARIESFHASLPGTVCTRVENSFTHLDVVGAQTVECVLRDVANVMGNSDFVVRFEYNSLYSLFKPLFVVAIISVLYGIYRALSWFVSLLTPKTKLE
ncbi:hypothetical protein RCL1_005473 [Eukaryota sp. TZLM3-RCL]